MIYIKALEESLCKKAIINFQPLQPGDVLDTHADIKNLKKEYGYEPITSVRDGVCKFAKWFLDYYKV